MIFKVWNKIAETMHENISEIGFDIKNQPYYAIVSDNEEYGGTKKGSSEITLYNSLPNHNLYHTRQLILMDEDGRMR